MFMQIFLSPQLKRSLINSNKLVCKKLAKNGKTCLLDNYFPDLLAGEQIFYLDLFKFCPGNLFRKI